MGRKHITPVRESGGKHRQNLAFHLFDITACMESLAELYAQADDPVAWSLIDALHTAIDNRLERAVRDLERVLGGEIEVDYVGTCGGMIDMVYVGDKEVAA